MSENDPCKDCIQKAPPVTPPTAPVDVGAFRRELDAPSEEAVVSLALALLQWAIEESRRGQYILAGNPNTGTLSRLGISPLERVFRKAIG